MHDNVTSLDSILRPQGKRSDDADLELPELGDGAYRPFALPSNKSIHAIHFITAKRDIRSFQYIHLDSDSRYTPQRIEMRFLGSEPIRVTIHGRNLWTLYQYIHQHRMSFVAEAVRDFAGDGESVITKLDFVVVDTDK